MLSHEITSAAHAGDDAPAGGFAARSTHLAAALTGVAIAKAESQAAASQALPLRWRADEPRVGATSLTELILRNSWMRPGDAVYVTETRRYVLTDADLAAARTTIGGAS